MASLDEITKFVQSSAGPDPTGAKAIEYGHEQAAGSQTRAIDAQKAQAAQQNANAAQMGVIMEATSYLKDPAALAGKLNQVFSMMGQDGIIQVPSDPTELKNLGKATNDMLKGILSASGFAEVVSPYIADDPDEDEGDLLAGSGQEAGDPSQWSANLTPDQVFNPNIDVPEPQTEKDRLEQANLYLDSVGMTASERAKLLYVGNLDKGFRNLAEFHDDRFLGILSGKAATGMALIRTMRNETRQMMGGDVEFADEAARDSFIGRVMATTKRGLGMGDSPQDRLLKNKLNVDETDQYWKWRQALARVIMESVTARGGKALTATEIALITAALGIGTTSVGFKEAVGDAQKVNHETGSEAYRVLSRATEISGEPEQLSLGHVSNLQTPEDFLRVLQGPTPSDPASPAPAPAPRAAPAPPGAFTNAELRTATPEQLMNDPLFPKAVQYLMGPDGGELPEEEAIAKAIELMNQGIFRGRD